MHAEEGSKTFALVKKNYITTKMHVYIGSVKTTSPYIVQGSHGSMCSAVISSKEDN